MSRGLARIGVPCLFWFMGQRCRICTSNDREGLIEQLAEEMWASRRDREIDPPWENAGVYWQEAMRGFARTTISMLEAKH